MHNNHIQVLDHGFIRHIESWGQGDSGEMEAAIIEAARQSTQGNFRGWEKDEVLLKYLYNNKHSTPFEFCGMTIEVRAPIVVFREWHRHRTQSYNEMSARYSALPDYNYLPTMDRLFKTQNFNKQAQAISGSQELTETNASNWLVNLEELYKQIEAFYQFGLNIGIPKELARLPLPVGRYSQMRATGNLRNWLAFLTLRMDPLAQDEIRRFATVLGTEIIAKVFPRTWSLFANGKEYLNESNSSL